ncbi:hypothetical protein EV2_023847 [Malus domestica]
MRRMSPYSGCDPDLIVRLIDLFQKVVVLLLEQGVWDMDEVPYLIHFSHTSKYVIHFLFQDEEHGLLFSSSPLEGRLGSARNGPIFHSSTGHLSRLSTVMESFSTSTAAACRTISSQLGFPETALELEALKVHKPQPHQQVHVQILKINLHQDIHAVPNLVAAPSLYSPSLPPEAPDKTHLHRLQFSPPQIPPLTGGSSPTIRLWPAHANNSTPIELSSVWRFRRKLKEQKPCPPSASGLQLDSPGLTGYLIVEVNGGLNQQRSAICNVVAPAGLLNTVLVIPRFEFHNVWRDTSTFTDIYDEDHFIATLEGHVKVVKELPEMLMDKFDHNISNIPTLRVQAWAPVRYYTGEVYPVLQKQGVIRMAPFANRLARNVLALDVYNDKIKHLFEPENAHPWSDRIQFHRLNIKQDSRLEGLIKMANLTINLTEPFAPALHRFFHDRPIIKNHTSFQLLHNRVSMLEVVTAFESKLHQSGDRFQSKISVPKQVLVDHYPEGEESTNLLASDSKDLQLKEEEAATSVESDVKQHRGHKEE